MSYHYRGDNKRQQLLRQLSMVQNDLNNKNQSLQKLKLQAEFYQDKDKQIQKDKLSLADQIMNELISPPYRQNQKRQEYHPVEPKQQYAPYQPKPEYSNKPASFTPLPVDNHRENHFINQREIQKNKMQNQKHEGLFPNSSDHNRVRSFGKQQQPPSQYIPQKDNKIEHKLSPYGVNPPLKKALSPQEQSYNPSFNPFVRADQALKQKRQQSHKEYLRELQLQRQQQQRLKQQRERQKKLLKGQFHDFLPSNKIQPQKPITMKKNDPNSKPPKIQQIMGNYSQFDTNLIRSKGIEIKSKYKKGKITYEEYQRQINNLRKQYNGNLDDLLQNKVERESIQQPIATQRSPPKEPTQFQQQPFSNSLPIKQEKESINYSQFIPQQELPQRSNLNYTLPPQPIPSYAVPANVPPQYVELMKKMFEVCLKEVKQVYSQRLVSQDQAYQQTLNKFVQYTQNNFMTQQIPPIQTSQQQKQFYSDAKQVKDLFEKDSNIKKKTPPPSGQSLSNIPYGDSDNASYYDKSLSAIASKIPYLKTQKEQKIKESQVQLFYTKKYKVKKIEKFAFLSDPNQSNIEIPSTSTYLRNSNALQQLQTRFHQDLTQLRKLQSQQNSNRFTNKLNQNATYSSSQRRTLIDPKPVGSAYQSSFQQNPFLKKHISNDDNIMTFNQKQLRINSPINNYSPKSKKEILEQDQYQTQPRVKQDSKKVPSYIEEYEQRLNPIPNKALNFITMNNQLLRKYQKTQQPKKQHIMIQDASEVRQKDSNYFTNNDISPVKRNDYYEESLETIRSDFEPPNSKRINPQTITEHKHSLQTKSKSKPKRSLLAKPEEESQIGEMIGYSQTVQSIQQSSARNSRPPVAKRRPISKKKESSIARSKLNQESSLSKAFPDQSQLQEPLKFDSNVYESHYEESLEFLKTPHPQITANARFQTSDKDANIEIYAPTIVTPKSALQIQPNYSALDHKPKSSAPQSKLKSLEQARKLAKEYRVKAGDQSRDYRSVEQRFSQLQSFMTKRGDESVHIKKGGKQQMKKQKGAQGKRQDPKGKKDIMRMLCELQEDEDYKQDFQSYREQSEQYQ